MLIRMRHWNINLRQQSRSSLIAGSLHNEIHINTVHVKSSMTATQQAIGKGQKRTSETDQEASDFHRWACRQLSRLHIMTYKDRDVPCSPEWEATSRFLQKPTRQERAAFAQSSWCTASSHPAWHCSGLFPLQEPLLSVNCKTGKAVCWPHEQRTNIFMSLQTVSNCLREKDSWEVAHGQEMTGVS